MLYQQGRESIGQNMAGVSGGGDNGSVMADYGQILVVSML